MKSSFEISQRLLLSFLLASILYAKEVGRADHLIIDGDRMKGSWVISDKKLVAAAKDMFKPRVEEEGTIRGGSGCGYDFTLKYWSSNTKFSNFRKFQPDCGWGTGGNTSLYRVIKKKISSSTKLTKYSVLIPSNYPPLRVIQYFEKSNLILRFNQTMNSSRMLITQLQKQYKDLSPLVKSLKRLGESKYKYGFHHARFSKQQVDAGSEFQVDTIEFNPNFPKDLVRKSTAIYEGNTKAEITLQKPLYYQYDLYHPSKELLEVQHILKQFPEVYQVLPARKKVDKIWYSLDNF